MLQAEREAMLEHTGMSHLASEWSMTFQLGILFPN